MILFLKECIYLGLRDKEKERESVCVFVCERERGERGGGKIRKNIVEFDTMIITT